MEFTWKDIVGSVAAPFIFLAFVVVYLFHVPKLAWSNAMYVCFNDDSLLLDSQKKEIAGLTAQREQAQNAKQNNPDNTDF